MATSPNPQNTGKKPEADQYIEAEYLSDEDFQILEDTAEDTRARVKEQVGVRQAETDIEEIDVEVMLDKPTVGDGGTAETLQESMRSFELPGGIDGVAATSIAGYKYEIDKATGKPKNRNEDRWYVNPDTGFVAVVDGMGGGTMGSQCAELLADAIAENENDIPAAAKSAQKSLAENPSIGSADGACFMTAKISVGEAIDIHQCGDLDLYHYSSTGEAKFTPQSRKIESMKNAQSAFDLIDFVSQRQPGQVTVEHLLRQLVGQVNTKQFIATNEPNISEIVQRMVSLDKPYIRPTDAFYEDLRKMVVKAVTNSESNSFNYKPESVVEEGDWVILMSDGVTDNIQPHELDKLIRVAIRKNWTPEQVTEAISKVVDERIQLAAKKDPFAVAFHFKLDNATVVVMRVRNNNGHKKAA